MTACVTGCGRSARIDTMCRKCDRRERINEIEWLVDGGTS